MSTSGKVDPNGKLGFDILNNPVTVPVMSSPPVVTITNDTNSTTMANTKPLPGVSYTSIDPTDTTQFTPLGVGQIVAAKGGSGANANYAASWHNGISTGYPNVVVYDFIFDGSTFEFDMHENSGAQFHIMVDGQFVTQYPQTVGGTANNYASIKVAFGSAQTRHISIYMTSTNEVTLGMWRDKTNAFLPTPLPTRRLMIVGDSYEGGASSSPIGTFGKYLGLALGFTDIVNSGVGSTGWLANGSYTNLATRLQTDVIAQKPTDIVITMGHNDAGFTAAQITQQVQAVLAQIRTGLPNLRTLTVTGPLCAGSQVGTYGTINSAIRSGCQQADRFIDTITVPIFTGTGKTGNRVVSDGVTNSTTTVTSATAAFVAGDVGSIITGSGIPAYTTIASVTNSTTAVLSAAATASASGVSLTITNQKNDGNSDNFISTDGTHPVDAGSAYLGYALAHRILNAYEVH